MKNKPYWYLLLEHFCNTIGRTGISISFIIGSRTYFEQVGEEFNTIDALINEIFESQFDQEVKLYYCTDKQAWMLSLRPDIKIDKKFGYLSVSDSWKREFNLLDDIIIEMKSFYSDKIQQGQYSINENYEWDKYSRQDILDIESAAKKG